MWFSWRPSVAAVLIALLWIATSASGRSSADAPNCAAPWTGHCGVGANQGGGYFHGLIAVDGAPWVLNVAAGAGTQAGCGDCSWDFVLACAHGAPGDPGTISVCTGAAAGCRPDQLLYRVFLTTDAVVDEIVGTVCLGGGAEVRPIGDEAQAQVEQYLQDVVPPDLVITTRPNTATLAGLLTYFSARPPAALEPAPFGGPDVTETITIAPIELNWQWGDGAASGWTAADSTVTHTYVHGGRMNGALVARWGATYTLTYQGQSFGPYNATGQLTKQQAFSLPVHTSSPTLVSQ
jgi:hypothetical protein